MNKESGKAFFLSKEELYVIVHALRDYEDEIDKARQEFDAKGLKNTQDIILDLIADLQSEIDNYS